MSLEVAPKNLLPKISLELFIPNLPVDVEFRLEKIGKFDNEKFPMDGDWGKLEIPSLLPFEILSKLAPKNGIAKYIQPVIQVLSESNDHVHSVFIHKIVNGVISVEIRDLERNVNPNSNDYIQFLKIFVENGNTIAISETNLVKYDAFEFGELIPTRIMGIYKALEYLGFVLTGKINQQPSSKQTNKYIPTCKINCDGNIRNPSNGLTKSEIQAFDEIIQLGNQNITGKLFRR